MATPTTLEVLMKFRLLSTLSVAFFVAPLLALGANAPASTAGGPSVLGAQRAEAPVSRPSVRRVHDGRGDVLRVAERKGKDLFAPAPTRRHGDIAAFKIAHREAVVVGRVVVRKLTRQDRFFGAVLQLRTRRAMYTALVYRPGVGQPLDTAFGGGGKHACAQLGFDLDFADDTIIIRVPRACLGTPAWVRPRVVIDYFSLAGAGGPFFADAAPGTDLTPIPFMAKTWHR